MIPIAYVFAAVALRLLVSGLVQLYTAWSVRQERATAVGSRVFWDYLYSGGYDTAFALLILFGAIFGHFELDLPWWITVVLLIFFALKHRAVDRLALLVAGFVKPDAPGVDGQEIG